MRKTLFLLLLLVAHTINAQSDNRLWQIEATDYYGDYFGTPMANGGIGIMPWREPLSVRQVILNHVFDIDPNSNFVNVIRGINPFTQILKVEGRTVVERDITGWKQTVDMRHGLHTTEFVVRDKVKVTYTVCALRNMAYAGMVLVKVKALKNTDIEAVAHVDIPEECHARKRSVHHFNADGLDCYIAHAHALSAGRRVQVETASTFLYEPGRKVDPEYVVETHELCCPFTLRKGEEVSYALVGSVCTSRDFPDPYNEAERQIVYAQHEGFATLMAAHLRAWDEMWQGDIEIEGDDDAQRAVRFALFNLYSSCREGSDLSIPPMGLSSQGYNGHIFWDTELWMYPPMLMLNHGIAESMMNYRANRLPAARRKATAYGYRGAMFPWESDDTGSESTPTQAVCGTLEQHITADVGIACWNYYCVTRDKRWLEDKGYPLIKEVATFWASRATRNDDGSWSVNSVVGADEYVSGADDNAFTNGAAKVVLRNAVKAAKVVGRTPDPKWTEVADGLRLCKMPDGVTAEHAKYNGEKIKQADVNLLGYPLGVITDEAQLRKDLDYYALKIDPKYGPAMSFSVLSVQYARLGDGQKAYEMFCKGYKPNQRPPFGALAEAATGNHMCFMTGAGGLLQAVINGFCGLQVTDDGIVQLPTALPKHWRKVTVKGVGPEGKVYVNQQK